MGFGLLFLGYLFMFNFPYKGFDVLPDLLGFVIAYLGVRTLAEYGCGWDDLKKYFLVILPASGATFVFQILGLFGIGNSVYEIWSYAYIALVLVYNIIMLVAVYKIANDTGVGSIKAKVRRNLIIGAVYYLLVIFFSIPVKAISDLKVYLSTNYALGAFVFILGFLWLIFNCTVIFSCYMWICKEGDESMPPSNKRVFLSLKNKKEKENKEE